MKRYIWSRFLHKLFLRRRSGKPGQAAARLRRPFVRPQLEGLEDRTLLSGQTFLVNIAGDPLNTDGTPVGSGTSGTLRYCIQQADLAQNTGSTINFSSTVGNLITLQHGELVISQSMTLNGPGASGLTISGGYQTITTIFGGTFTTPGSRVFDVTSNAGTVTIAGLTIANGNASPFVTLTPGSQGGDIFNGSNLSLNNDIVTDGTAVGSPNGQGGGIFNASGTSGGTGALLTLNNTTVDNNIAQGSGTIVSGVYVPGAGQGGGIFNDTNATVVIAGGSQLLANQAVGSVGANGTAGAAGANSTSAGPGGAGGAGTDGQAGGAGEGGGIFSRGKLTISGSTFYNNLAQGGLGGLGGNGGSGGTGGASNSKASPGGKGGVGGAGGGGGAGGAGEGGAVFNSGTLGGIFSSQFTANIAQSGVGGGGGVGGTGGAGGVGGTSSAGGGVGAIGGTGGAGGASGMAQGGGIYSMSGTLTVNSGQFFASNVIVGNNTVNTGNEAISATGGAGGAGGIGGNGGAPGSKAAPGNAGTGGTGGAGGASGLAAGGSIMNDFGGGNVTLASTTFTTSLVTSGVGGVGGVGGEGALDGSGARIGINGTGGNGGAAGSALGGAVGSASGSMNVASTSFGGTLTNAGNNVKGGVGGAGGSSGSGGLNGNRGEGGAGGNAYGGGLAVFGNATNVAFDHGSFVDNSIISGAGGSGGAGSFGLATTGGDGGASGSAWGGGFSYNAGSGNTSNNGIILGTTPFTGNQATAGTGGAGNNGGNGGAAGPVRGGGMSVSDLFGILNLTAGSSAFTSNVLTGGVGGQSGFSTAGAGSSVFGGGIDLQGAAAALGTATLTGSPISSNQITGGMGGFGQVAGQGGNASGGGLSSFDYSLSLTSSQISTNQATSGSGSSGFADGGNAGTANGGGISANADNAATPVTYSLTTNDVLSNTLKQGNGGNSQGFGRGGDASPSGGVLQLGVQGAGVSLINGNANIQSSNITGNSGTAGAGGHGGDSVGGRGGSGGAALGGGVFFLNNVGGTLNFTFNGGSASNNTLTGGSGGIGGHASAAGAQYITGGNGGAGGTAQGGGVLLAAGANSINSFQTTGINAVSIIGNTLTGGQGAAGGAGSSSFGTPTPGPASAGGAGGNAFGGGIYNTSLNTTASSLVSVTNSVLASNHATGGAGGNGGVGTTANGGPGGNGGAGGNAFGGGIYEGDNATLLVSNTTIGGPSASSSNPTANSNVLAGGLGGNGGNAGTPNNVIFNNGGNGGNGGSVEGGGVFADGGTTDFTNDTIASNQAVASSLGGSSGAGAGPGSSAGSPGANGTGSGGGYFANIGSNDNVINTIIALNAAVVGPDANGNFTSGNGQLPVPVAPTLAVGTTGGTWTPQTAWVVITYVNANGETTGSQVSSIAVPANGTLTIDSPAAAGAGASAATGWYAYVGVGAVQPPNSAMFRQQPVGSPTPIGTNLTLTANPTTSGVNPSNTSAINAGHNIIGNGNRALGFSSAFGDQVGVLPAQLGLGPLLNNGGPTLTDALLPASPTRAASFAIDTGNNNLVDPNQPTDQRLAGYPRIYNGAVDVGAFEFQPPVIVTMSPISTPSGSSSVTLTITGTGFEPGATVSFGKTTLTPSSISGTTQITVTVPGALLTGAGNVVVTVNNPDGSGTGSTVSSNGVVFTVTGGGILPPPPPSPGPSPSPSPGPSPSPSPSGSLATTTTIVSVSNQYPGFIQQETVTVAVTNANGFSVNTGEVVLQVNGQTIFAPVVNGVATATITSSFFDFNNLIDLFFAHPLTVTYTDNTGPFVNSSSFLTEPAILLDFFLTLLSQQLGPVSQFQ